MTLKLYNTLTRKKEIVKPLEKDKIKMYTCGPTVYDFAHIGNWRTFVFNDILRRYLIYRGFEVKQVMNLTDVDDKTIKRSKKENCTLKELTEKYTEYFFEDMKKLNVQKPDIIAKATDHIQEMVDIIEMLLKKGIAYKSEDGSVYYNIKKFKEYGKLAHLDKEGLKAGARVANDEYEKENAQDFALWKAHAVEDGDVCWEKKIGKGRPGWHIECSAMSTKYLGESFDIHTGGVDLIFPHHENEIAQSEGAFGKSFVKYWVHSEHLLVDGRKMSKSLKNFYTLRDFQEQDIRAMRYIFLSTHYRQQLNFTKESVDAAKQAIERLDNFIEKLESDNGKEKKDAGVIKNKFESAMDDDLNIPQALASIFEFVREANKVELTKENTKEIKKVFLGIDEVLGLNLEGQKKESVPSEVVNLAKARQEARKKGDFKKSDLLREEIKKKGFLVEDTKDGFKVKKV